MIKSNKHYTWSTNYDYSLSWAGRLAPRIDRYLNRPWLGPPRFRLVPCKAQDSRQICHGALNDGMNTRQMGLIWCARLEVHSSHRQGIETGSYFIESPPIVSVWRWKHTHTIAIRSSVYSIVKCSQENGRTHGFSKHLLYCLGGKKDFFLLHKLIHDQH